MIVSSEITHKETHQTKEKKNIKLQFGPRTKESTDIGRSLISGLSIIWKVGRVREATATRWWIRSQGGHTPGMETVGISANDG
jgi:hypothetical protein